MFLLLFLSLAAISEEPKPVTKSLLEEYRDTYAITGKPDTKIQLSFRYQVLRALQLHVGYTQKMFWALGTMDSSPFTDINYNPEIFNLVKVPWLYEADFQFGYAHESNGEDGSESRAIDYLSMIFSFEDSLVQDVSLNTVFHAEESNSDYREYVGPVSVTIQLAHLLPNSLRFRSFSIMMYTGGVLNQRLDRPSVEVGMSWRLFPSLSPVYLSTRYFRGYAENLVDYNLLSESYRIGLGVNL